MNTRSLMALAATASAALSSAPALADDPYDPAMQDRASREADAAGVRQLNIDQARYVRERDARYAEGWERTSEYPARQARYEGEVARYEARRAEYEARLAKWRRAVQLCREGYREYCR